MASDNYTLQQLLTTLVEKNGSDLHLSVGSPVQIRIDGKLNTLNTPVLTPERVKTLCYAILSPEQIKRFEENKELDFSFALKGLSRFRVNLFFQKGSVGGAFRTIPFKFRSFEELNLPPVIANSLIRKPQGLVLVTGPTGSGKTTTLASIIDEINKTRRAHIITIEDPIEYLHQHKLCLVNQREVGLDTSSFKVALKYALRQDPDILLVGEMRDLETIEAAITISETGHLVFATLHTNSCVQTINRIIDVFPPHQQEQIRIQLSFVLEGIIAQRLIPRVGGGRILCCEVLIPNPAIKNLIREEKIHQIYSQMQLGQDKFGMQTLNQSLLNLYSKGLISFDDIMNYSYDIEELKKMMGI